MGKHRQITIIILYLFLFIFIYFSYITNLYILPNNFKFPLIVFIGFAILIIIFFSFFINIKNFKESDKYSIKFFNENLINLILISLMFITYFIPPISFTQSIIDWNNINFFNYLRAIIFIFGLSFIPGSCLFNLLFPNSTLYKKFNVDPFLIKITVYPLLSFAILGFLTFILDYIKIPGFLISHILFAIIIALFIVSFYTQKNGNDNYKLKISKTIISKSTIYILVIGLAIIFIGLGIHLSSRYLIPGDNWRGVKYAYYVGNPDADPYSKFYGGYTMYWGYISFALSSLSGIPYININTFLFPFLYLYITSIFLFTKAILHNFKVIYAILSSSLIITFSGLFYIYNNDLGIVPRLTLYGIIQFSFYSYSYFSMFTALAIFLILLKTSKIIDSKPRYKTIYKKEAFFLIFLSTWLFLNSYLLYYFPAVSGFLFIILYILFSKKSRKKYDMKIFLIFLVIFWILYVIYDFLSQFYFSFVPLNYFHYFFGTLKPPISNRIVLLYCALIVNTFIFCFLAIYYLIYKIYLKYYMNRFNKYYRFKVEILFGIILGLFSILLEFEISLNLILKSNQGFFLFYLDLIISNIGFIGILGIYSTYKCYISDKKLFYFLLSWFICILGYSSILLFYNWFRYSNLSPLIIPQDNYYYMIYWFSRNWYIIIIPLSIFCSIGLLKLREFIIQYHSSIKKHKNLILIFKLIIISGFILFSLSNTIIYGIYWSDKYNANATKPVYINDDEAQIMGWVSRNIPSDSDILIDRYILYHLIDIALCPTFFIWEEIEDVSNKYNYSSNSILNENIQIFIQHLRVKNIIYFIMNEWNEDVYQNLLNNYYSIILYSYGRLILYSTPEIF